MQDCFLERPMTIYIYIYVKKIYKKSKKKYDNRTQPSYIETETRRIYLPNSSKLSWAPENNAKNFQIGLTTSSCRVANVKTNPSHIILRELGKLSWKHAPASVSSTTSALTSHVMFRRTSLVSTIHNLGSFKRALLSSRKALEYHKNCEILAIITVNLWSYRTEQNKKNKNIECIRVFVIIQTNTIS